MTVKGDYSTIYRRKPRICSRSMFVYVGLPLTDLFRQHTDHISRKFHAFNSLHIQHLYTPPLAASPVSLSRADPYVKGHSAFCVKKDIYYCRACLAWGLLLSHFLHLFHPPKVISRLIHHPDIMIIPERCPIDIVPGQ